MFTTQTIFIRIDFLKDDGENITMCTNVILYRAHSKDHEYVKIKSLRPIVLSLEGLKVEIFK